MAQERVQRRLAAILAADMVGYSRLMREDEAGTLAQLKSLRRELLDPKVEEYGGRVVKTTGDGILIEFPSAVDAVQHAADVQQVLGRRALDVPAGRRIELRMGINVGDVIVEGDDLFGDGVNVASRLEGLAQPGAICISGSVYEQVRHKIDLAYDDLGEQSVKNIADPIHVYQIAGGGGDDTHGPSAADAVLRRPAVAVLPFENLSGDPEQDYFADGLTEDIITALSLWKSFPVIARNSCFAYKGQSPDIRNVGRELAASYVIEGSVRKAGDRVRVTAQLINAETGHHVWAERYDRGLDDIFSLQDEITERIATTVAPELERAERQRSSSKPPSDLQAWDLYLRGTSSLHELTEAGTREARALFERAVVLDPAYSRGHAGIAYSHYRDAFLGYSEDPERSVAQCVEAAQRAVALDDTDAFARFVLSRGLEYAGRFDEGLREAERAVELNPYDAHCLGSLGSLLISAGRPDEGIGVMRQAHLLSPKYPRIYLWLRMESYGHFAAGRYDEAATMAQEALARRPNDPELRAWVASCFANVGRIDEARAALANGEPIDREFLDRILVVLPLSEPDLDRFMDGLRKAGWEG